MRRGIGRSQHGARPDRGFALVSAAITVAVTGAAMGMMAELFTQAVDQAVAGACGADRRALANAATAYVLLEQGEIPATGTGHDRYEETLRHAGLLVTVSTYHDVTADGTVVASPTSPC